MRRIPSSQLSPKARAGRKAKRKGGTGEREAAGLLSSLFYPGGEGKFIRTPQSGAWGASPVLCGDLVPVIGNDIDRRIPWFWEIKTRAKDAISIFAWMESNASQVLGWHRTSQERRTSPEQVIILLWKSNFTAWYVTLSGADIQFLTDTGVLAPATLPGTRLVTRITDQESYVTMPFKAFSALLSVQAVLTPAPAQVEPTP